MANLPNEVLFNIFHHFNNDASKITWSKANGDKTPSESISSLTLRNLMISCHRFYKVAAVFLYREPLFRNKSDPVFFIRTVATNPQLAQIIERLHISSNQEHISLAANITNAQSADIRKGLLPFFDRCGLDTWYTANWSWGILRGNLDAVNAALLLVAENLKVLRLSIKRSRDWDTVFKSSISEDDEEEEEKEELQQSEESCAYVKAVLLLARQHQHRSENEGGPLLPHLRKVIIEPSLSEDISGYKIWKATAIHGSLPLSYLRYFLSLETIKDLRVEGIQSSNWSLPSSSSSSSSSSSGSYKTESLELIHPKLQPKIFTSFLQSFSHLKRFTYWETYYPRYEEETYRSLCSRIILAMIPFKHCLEELTILYPGWDINAFVHKSLLSLVEFRKLRVLHVTTAVLFDDTHSFDIQEEEEELEDEEDEEEENNNDGDGVKESSYRRHLKTGLPKSLEILCLENLENPAGWSVLDREVGALMKVKNRVTPKLHRLLLVYSVTSRPSKEIEKSVLYDCRVAGVDCRFVDPQNLELSLQEISCVVGNT